MLAPGTSVRQYEIVRQLGEGGMATVYLAREPQLGREVALKELASFGQTDPAYASRFLREAQTAGQLSHPNIVTVYDFFEENGTPYIAMEYVEGGTLRPLIGRLTFAQIGGVLEGLLAGLEHAEGFHIVHRDLKPENLMVARDGHVKIADYGMAKALDSMGAALTAVGMTVGTPNYMAPEQAMARELGPYTDVYSVGILAYELVLSRTPFEDAPRAMDILLRHVNEQPRALHEVNSNTPLDFSQWVSWLLAKEPAARPAGAAAAWDELEGILIGSLGPRWRDQARLPVEERIAALAPAAPPQPAPAAPTPAGEPDIPPELAPTITPADEVPLDEVREVAERAREERRRKKKDEFDFDEEESSLVAYLVAGTVIVGLVAVIAYLLVTRVL